MLFLLFQFNSYSGTHVNILHFNFIQVGWYNDKVDEKFQLDYDYNTLAVVVVSTPDMFEEAFRSFINHQGNNGTRDPIDDCVAYYFQQAKDVRFCSQSFISVRVIYNVFAQ